MWGEVGCQPEPHLTEQSGSQLETSEVTKPRKVTTDASVQDSVKPGQQAHGEGLGPPAGEDKATPRPCLAPGCCESPPRQQRETTLPYKGEVSSFPTLPASL